MWARCAGCGIMFETGDKQARTDRYCAPCAAASQRPARPIVCGRCRRWLGTDGTLAAGSVIVCPQCGTQSRIPSGGSKAPTPPRPPEPESQHAAAVSTPQERAPQTPPTTPPRQDEKKKTQTRLDPKQAPPKIARRRTKLDQKSATPKSPTSQPVPPSSRPTEQSALPPHLATLLAGTLLVTCTMMLVVGREFLADPQARDTFTRGLIAVIVLGLAGFLGWTFRRQLVVGGLHLFHLLRGACEVIYNQSLGVRARWEEYRRNNTRSAWEVRMREELRVLRQQLEKDAGSEVANQMELLRSQKRQEVHKELADFADAHRQKLKREAEERIRKDIEQARKDAYNDAHRAARDDALRSAEQLRNRLKQENEQWAENDRQRRNHDIKSWEEAERRRLQQQIDLERAQKEKDLQLWEAEEKDRCLERIDAMVYCSDEWLDLIEEKCQECGNYFHGPEAAYECRCGAWHCDSCLAQMELESRNCQALGQEGRAHSSNRGEYREIKRLKPGKMPSRKKTKYVDMTGGHAQAPAEPIRHISLINR